MEVGSLGVNGAHVLRRVALGHSTAPGAVPGLARHMVVKSVLGLLDRPGDVILITALVSNGLGKIDHRFLFGYMLSEIGGNVVVTNLVRLLTHMVVKSVLGLLDRPGDVILITALVSNGLGKIDHCFLFGYMLSEIGGNVLVTNLVRLLTYNKRGYF